MKVLKKISIIFMCALLLFITTYCTVSNAAGTSVSVYGTIKNLAGSSTTGSAAVSSVNNMAGAVISITKVICAGVAIIMITVIAMKYMLAAPSEKADIKKHAVVYVVGAIVMFAATAILQIIQNFAITALPE